MKSGQKNEIFIPAEEVSYLLPLTNTRSIGLQRTDTLAPKSDLHFFGKALSTFQRYVLLLMPADQAL